MWMEPINYRAMNGACGPEFISFSKAQRIESLRLLHTSADSFKVILLLPWTNCFFETQAITVFQKSIVLVGVRKQNFKIAK